MSFVSFYKKPQPRGYSTRDYLVEDTSLDSPDYFQITEFSDALGGGRYIMKLKGNGLNLRADSDVDIEVIDANGDNMFAEVNDYVDRFNDYYITIEVYDITARGLAIIYLVGEAAVDLDGNPIPESPLRDYNVRWSRAVNIVPMERNTSKLVFNEPPNIDIVQVQTPEREFTNAAALSGSQYLQYTSSVDDFTIITPNFKGYDLDFQSSKDILDVNLQRILLNPLQKPTTVNSVNSSIRKEISEIQNGYRRDLTTRFNTTVKSVSGSIQKDFLGGTFEFKNVDSTPAQFKPVLPSSFTISGSSSEQLKSFTANIVEVLTDTEMRISKPIELVTLNDRGYRTTQRVRESSGFTASIAYLPSDQQFVTSSTVNMNYLETTFSDMKPIGGDVYRIKTSYRRGTSTGDFKVIYDSAIKPVEYLTDAAFPNQTTYAKRDSDFRLIGHFTEQSIASSNWAYYIETPNAIYPGIIPPINSSSLHESVDIEANFTHSGLFSTQFNQNYNLEQLYTLGFNLTLEPNMELEVYMNSDPLSTNTSIPNASPKSFLKDINLEKDRYGGGFNRFGKFIGRVQNKRGIEKNYGRVEFDFKTDGSGLGAPVFRVKPIQFANINGSAYCSEISIKPLAINGFSPNLVQFQIPMNSEIDDVLAVSQSLDFKIEYFNYTGEQSEYVTFLNDLSVNVKTEIPTNACQANILNFQYVQSIQSGSFN
tara:strand:+ start:2298 stop:4415 length:2118 start_codon:yes stop_codon:yes gene_type:complete